ncbi:hypothetical protein [Duganella sp. BuS-21]|uniref:hypothetical protein n=1 Tax=Duganella sp. BuS-21 TaxID=2943848 RepID=UPI0035A5DD4D
MLGELREAEVSAETIGTLSRELKHLVKNHVGVTVRVTLLGSGGVERTSTGKAKRVLDRRHIC